MDLKEFGRFVARLRHERGLTQSQLAEELGVTDKAVSRWERAVGFPDITLLAPLASALGVSVSELVAARRFDAGESSPVSDSEAEDIAAAKARGVRFGRPSTPLPENFHGVYQRWKAGKITGVAAAKECGMPISTFCYRASVYGNAKLLPKC